MCGIIAVLRRQSRRTPPTTAALLARVTAAESALGADEPTTAALAGAATELTALDASLKGTPGLITLLAEPTTAGELHDRLTVLQARVRDHESALDERGTVGGDDQGIEEHNAALVALKDAVWAVLRDRLRHKDAVRELAGGGELRDPTTVAAFSGIEIALAALDRLEVRGRDSAGVSIVVSGIDVTAAPLTALLEKRDHDPLLQNGAVRVADGCLDFVYKYAAEIGELGDNVAALRRSIQGDALLQAALRAGGEVLVLGHTRWASVGIISEPNAHPLNHEETGEQDEKAPYVLGALNGDVDNHLELVERHGLQLDPAITTDAKVIPALVSRELTKGTDFAEAFRRTVASFEGSVAIGAAGTADPNQLALALRGSGQALYVGLAEDTFVVASEPYGVIEECERYLRMDGETPGNPGNPSASRGQVVTLARSGAGEISGITRQAYDGTALPVAETDLTTATVTTRDIDRADHAHFLSKEIHESPDSFKKTLRGRIVRVGERLRVALPARSLPRAATDLMQSGCRRVLVIGQGTAAVAGQAVAASIADELRGSGIGVQALPATELSGFGLDDDMADTLIVAISQSGTTTDTNRTVDLVRARGATVLAIVNRRGSDLCDKADGVLYTSDGRDIEMSVASTKAFYAQCAAGQLLALALARAAGRADDAREHELLEALIALPTAMRLVLDENDAITEVARRVAPPRRYWALVGNGKNRVAAAEIRIKLSELCYKSIACDATEDKKHIDLSSEPMILVCAAGLTGSTANDVSKEVAIYSAHKACPVVITTAGETRFTAAAAATITVPQVHPALAYVLSTMAGHLFGYRAALAIDELALPLRRMRVAIENEFGSGDASSAAGNALDRVHDALRPQWLEFKKDLQLGRYDGTLEARTATRLNSLLNYTLGLVPLDVYAVEFGEAGTPGKVLDALTDALTQAIDELTRPVDAIKHQAKTVTVGISRADEALLTLPLVRAVLEAGAGRDHLGYRDLRALAGLDPAVVEVLGSTRYRIDGDLDGEGAAPQIHVIDQRGAAKSLRSRTSSNPTLKGTKHLVAMERQCMVAKGRSDERTVILVPEVEQNRTVGLTLLHVKFEDHMPSSALRSVLSTYRNRYNALADAVTETEPEFDTTLLEAMPVVDLLCEPIYSLADRWRQGTLKS